MSDVTLLADTLVSASPRVETGLCPFVSVIVPVRNEVALIGRTLDQLLRQDYPPDRFEVLVADGGSTDGTRTVVAGFAAEFANVRLVDNPRRWSSAGRNAGLRASRGDVVIIVDGHCELDNPRYLADLADAFTTSGADCVGRPQPLDVSGASRLQRAVAAARASRLGHHPDSHIWSDRPGFVPPHSVAVAYRREVFRMIGPFDERFDACEDVELNHRVAQAGLRCWFAPRLRVCYHPRTSLGGLFRQMLRYGRGRVRLLRKHPETFALRGFLPAVLLAGLAAGPLFWWWGGPFAAAWLGGAAPYALAVLLFSVALCMRQREAALLPLLPLVFLAIHLGAGAGQLWEAVAGGWGWSSARGRLGSEEPPQEGTPTSGPFGDRSRSHELPERTTRAA
jgi:succinoglycan biosynthesis protein ExoA